VPVHARNWPRQLDARSRVISDSRARERDDGIASGRRASSPRWARRAGRVCRCQPPRVNWTGRNSRGILDLLLTATPRARDGGRNDSVQGTEHAMHCPYCPPHGDAFRVVFRNDLALFSQDERYQGALKHSGIIVPAAHRVTVFDLTEEEVVATFGLLAVVKRWMDAEFRPSGYNIGWNCGATGGQEVFHAHMHVIPRFSQEPLAGKGIRSLLKSDANRW
jgi:histidine triad (HIT) family protein